MSHEKSTSRGSFWNRIRGGGSENISNQALSGRNVVLDKIEGLAHTANTHHDTQVRRDAVSEIHGLQSGGPLRGADLNPRTLTRMGYPNLSQEVRDATEGAHPPKGAPTRDWVTGKRGTQGRYRSKRK